MQYLVVYIWQATVGPKMKSQTLILTTVECHLGVNRTNRWSKKSYMNAKA